MRPLRAPGTIPSFSAVRLLDPADETRVVGVISVEAILTRARHPVPDQMAPFIHPSATEYPTAERATRRGQDRLETGKVRKPATCHPAKRPVARGLCRACYDRWSRAKWRGGEAIAAAVTEMRAMAQEATS